MLSKQQQVNTILAALRLLQNHMEPVPMGDQVEDILTNEGQDAAPSVEEINELCENVADLVF